MRLFAVTILATLCAPAAASVSMTGFVDGLGNGGAGGWACASDPGLDVQVVAAAGPVVVGVYPRNADRPDAAPYCPGSHPVGFQIVFDAAAQAMFAGQTNLTLFEVVPGLPWRALPSSNAQTVNPLPLPYGRLLGLGSNQLVSGTVAALGGPPSVSLFAGSLSDVGAGVQTGTPAGGLHGHYSVALPVPGRGEALPVGGLLPVFGSSTSVAGVTAQLAGALPLGLQGGMAHAGTLLAASALVAQSGVVSGITNTTLTTWMPAGTGFAGLSGAITFSGNDTTFSEALVEVGTTADTQAACLLRNNQAPPGVPLLSRLWAGILKTNDTRAVSIPVNVALGHVVPAQPGGTCLMTWVSAGYPFLSASAARYTRTAVALQASVVPVPAGAPAVLPFGVGGEFRAPAGLMAPAGVYVGVMATQPLTVDGIAGTASAAPVVGAPSGLPWATPTGGWQAGANFMYLPAPVCATAHLRTQPANGPVAVLRNYTPVTIAVPPGAMRVLDMPMWSRGAQAIQRSAYVSFPAGGFSGRLGAGDCLLSYMTGYPGPAGAVDVESQSTVYLRLP